MPARRIGFVCILMKICWKRSCFLQLWVEKSISSAVQSKKFLCKEKNMEAVFLLALYRKEKTLSAKHLRCVRTISKIFPWFQSGLSADISLGNQFESQPTKLSALNFYALCVGDFLCTVCCSCRRATEQQRQG